jgi:hypothetical protein
LTFLPEALTTGSDHRTHKGNAAGQRQPYFDGHAPLAHPPSTSFQQIQNPAPKSAKDANLKLSPSITATSGNGREQPGSGEKRRRTHDSSSGEARPCYCRTSRPVRTRRRAKPLSAPPTPANARGAKLEDGIVRRRCGGWGFPQYRRLRDGAKRSRAAIPDPKASLRTASSIRMGR